MSGAKLPDAYQAYMKLHGFVGRIRRSRRIRRSVQDA